MRPRVPSSSLALLASVLLGFAPATAADRPNVVLIVTDDQGYGDLGFHGNPVLRTPNLDRLAHASARMSTFYVSPVCAPTRASLMTGRSNYRTRCIDTYVGRAMLEPDEVTLAEILHDAGYATGIFGKWHLGDAPPMRPIDQGFEASLVHRGGGIGQPSDPPGGESKYTDAVLFKNGQRVETTGYCTDVYFDAAMGWIDRAQAEHRPFFVYIATNAPHGPFHDVPPDLYRQYQRIDLSNARFPLPGAGHPLPEDADLDRRARIFAMITNIDDNVGRLLQHLSERRLTGDTLVLFMVDNGPNGRRFVAGMRGMKGDVHEGGIRSPFFARWPGRLDPGHASDRVAAHIDVLPTILDACGVAPPADLALDGRSLLPLLEGKDVEWPDRTLVIQAHRGDEPIRYHHFAARNDRWKLLNASGFHRDTPEGPPAFELYDMRRDPLEKNDLAASRPEVVAEMKAAYDRWFDDVGRTRPDNYAPPRIHVGTAPQDPVTLTRQDWRHPENGGRWTREIIGEWRLHVVRAGVYDVTCRFPATSADTAVRLAIGDVKRMTPVPPGATGCRFTGVELPAGDADLQVMLIGDGARRGAHQVDVTRASR